MFWAAIIALMVNLNKNKIVNFMIGYFNPKYKKKLLKLCIRIWTIIIQIPSWNCHIYFKYIVEICYTYSWSCVFKKKVFDNRAQI